MPNQNVRFFRNKLQKHSLLRTPKRLQGFGFVVVYGQLEARKVNARRGMLHHAPSVRLRQS
jgi:hypothetical protein